MVSIQFQLLVKFIKYLRYLILINFLSLFLLAVPIFTFSQGQQQPGGPGQQNGETWSVPNPLEAESFEELITEIADFVFTLGIPIAVIVIIAIGLQFMFAGGSEEKIAQAKRNFLWAIVGLVIILLANGLIYLIEDILKVK